MVTDLLGGWVMDMFCQTPSGLSPDLKVLKMGWMTLGYLQFQRLLVWPRNSATMVYWSRGISSRLMERQSTSDVMSWMAAGARNKVCCIDTLSNKALRQVLQTPVMMTISLRGRRPMMSQSSSLVPKTACAAWWESDEAMLVEVTDCSEEGVLVSSICDASDCQ